MSSTSSIPPPAYPTIFTTATTQKYSVRNAEYNYFYIPSAKSEEQKTTEPLQNALEMEWIPHSRSTVLLYVLTALVTTVYYAASFLFQYGNYLPRSRGNVLDEPFLTRVVVVEWLVVLAVLATGVLFHRRLFMPLYIFLAVLATNGTLVLFVLRLKQLVDGKIFILNTPLNLLAVLLFCALLHNTVYFYAMHLKMAETRRIVPKFQKTIPNSYSSIPNKFIDIV